MTIFRLLDELMKNESKLNILFQDLLD